MKLLNRNAWKIGLIAGVVLFLLIWLTAQLYLWLDATLLQDSDLCIWMALARQILDHGISSGIWTYYNRSLVDLLFALPIVKVFGFSTMSSLFSYAVPYVVAFTILGCAVSMRRDGCVRWFDIPGFLMFNALAGALYGNNAGHALTFSFAAAVYQAVALPEMRTCWRWTLVFIVSCLGDVNDEYFLLMAVLPLVGLNVLQFLCGRCINWLSVPLLFGVCAGKALLAVLRSSGLVDNPKIEMSLYPFARLPAMLDETIVAYAKNFAVADYFGVHLEAEGLAFLVLLAFAAISLGYMCVRSPTKPENNIEPHYVYYGGVLALALLLANWRRIMPTRRLKRVFVVLTVCVAISSLYRGVWLCRHNATSRDGLTEMAKRLKAEGIGTAYSEWWTAYALAAESNGELRIYPLIHVPQVVDIQRMYYVKDIYSVECHAVILPLNRGHYPIDVAEKSTRARFGEPDCIFDAG